MISPFLSWWLNKNSQILQKIMPLSMFRQMQNRWRPKNRVKKALPVVVLLLASACAPVTSTPLPSPVIPTMTSTQKPTNTTTPLPPATSTPTLTFSPTFTLTPQPTETDVPTLTIEPSYVELRGVVNQGHVNCYYGPSKAYLYKYGLLKGNRLDIIGWLPDTGYLEVQAIGGDNPCWMNMEFMDIDGDVNSVKPVHPDEIKLPMSPYYPALAFAKAERDGDEVTVTWSPLKLKAGDDSEQEPYLLEAWVCRAGRLTFVPVGAYQNQVKVVDEPGCEEPSHARVYGVEKHGYTRYLEFEWPGAD
jgi:hypothetical protein